MTPYYMHGGVTIYHGDCRDILPSLRADVAITDPPYNVGLDYCDGDRRFDYEVWCRQWFALVRTAVRAVALTPGIGNLGQWYRISEPDWVLAWHKPGAMGRCVVGFNNWEPILFWGEGKSGRGPDVITARRMTDAALNDHPCPKPEQWASGLIGLLTDPHEVVMDPFMGTGTTLVAAKRLGRVAIGIDIEERYCELSARRLGQDMLPFVEQSTLTFEASDAL